MHTVKKSYRDAVGGAITGAAGWIEARDDEGNVFDFDDGTWKATAPAQPQGALAESALVPGDYEYAFDESSWGTRTVTYLLFVGKQDCSPEMKEETRTFINGALAISTFTPVAPPGSVLLTFSFLNPDGTTPSTVLGWAYILQGPTGYAYDGGAKAGAWDPEEKTLSWTLPIGCPLIHVLVPAAEENSYWSTVGASEPINLNTTSPIRRL